MFEELRELILRDYPVFSGVMLEGYFKAKLGAFFEKNPAKKKLAGKRRGVSLADM